MKKIATLVALLTIFTVIAARTSNAQTTATVTAVALQPSVSVGTPAVVEIRIAGGQNLSSYNFVLSYNPAVLRIDTPTTSVTNGPFLASSGRSVSPLPPSVNNTTGTVEFGTFSYGGLDNGASGNGVLATITFTTLSAGNSPLNLSNVQLYQADLNATAQPNTAVNGTQIVSAVALPSPTPTPGASASPNDASVTIQASFEGLDQDRGDKLVNVQLVRAGSSPIVRNGVRFVYTAPGVYSTQTPITDATLIAGTYNVYLNGPTHLTKLFGNQVINAGSAMLNLVSSPPILTADIIDDNVIDTLDFNRMINNFGCRLNVNPPVEPVGKTCTPLASDVDFDQDVDIFDYSYLVGNYNIIGD